MKLSMYSVPELAGKTYTEASPMGGCLVDEAIIKSLCYADIFSFPLTLDEIVCFAPHANISIDEAAQRLNFSESLRSVVKQDGELFHLDGREDNCQYRPQWERESKERLEISLRRLVPVQGIPFLRAAAVTGALAAFNSPTGDDIDLLIIASRRRAWTTFFFLRLWRRFGHNPDLCFNLFLTEDDLVFRNQNLFYAREILGAIPILNTAAFKRFIDANLWVYDVFPSHTPDPVRQNYRLDASPAWRRQQQLAEKVMAGPVGNLIEAVLRKIQSRSLGKAIPDASSRMRRNRIKLHKQDHRAPILDMYEQRVDEWLERYREAAANEAGQT